jgi:phage shock protein A
MALPALGRRWSLARKIEDLFELHGKVRESLQVVDERLEALEDRFLRFEAEPSRTITEARSAATAASAASTVVAGGIISDAVTRITRLEGRADQLEQRRLQPPLINTNRRAR